MLGANPHDARAMFELNLELHDQAQGKRPVITADELLDLHLLLAQLNDFRSLANPEPE